MKAGCRRFLEERGGHDRTEECRDEGQEKAEGKNESERTNQAHGVLLNRSDQVKHRKPPLLLKGQSRTVATIISVKREKEENNLL